MLVVWCRGVVKSRGSVTEKWGGGETSARLDPQVGEINGRRAVHLVAPDDDLFGLGMDHHRPIHRLPSRAGCFQDAGLVAHDELIGRVALGDDDAVLALGVAAHVDCIVSGDRDWLTLKTFQGIAIVTPAKALRFIDSE